MELRNKTVGNEEELPQLPPPSPSEDTLTTNSTNTSLLVILQFIEKHPVKAAVFMVSLISGLIVGWVNGHTNK